jgi:4,5-dihydroxyphthalate decarboxylase
MQSTRPVLSFACGLYDRILALYTGEVRPAGFDLNVIPFHGGSGKRAIFDRMGGNLEFDIAEMSSSEYISLYAAGKRDFVAIPAFPSRVFRHSMIAVNRRRVASAKDLEGKRIGVPLYTMTAAVFARGLLQHEYGVDLSKIHWVQGAVNRETGGSHGSPSAPPLLKQVDLEDNKTGRPLNELLEHGELDATLGTVPPAALGRNPDIVRLFPDYRELEKEYYRRTKIFPIMHLIVVRRDIHEKYRFVASSLYDALVDAKNHQFELMKNAGSLVYMLPWMGADVEEMEQVFGKDPWPYGVEPNRPTLEALVTYLHEQGLIADRMPIEDLFQPIFERL